MKLIKINNSYIREEFIEKIVITEMLATSKNLLKTYCIEYYIDICSEPVREYYKNSKEVEKKLGEVLKLNQR